MQEKRNILICLDVLDIGGVETFVYNQSLAMKAKGHNVYILSKKGVFTEELKAKEINCIEFEFEDKIYYDLNEIEKILRIFQTYNIQEVHINQFSAMNVIMPACIVANIPYIVYLHMAAGIIEDEELNAYNYFERRFSTYQENFKLLFKYAHKIIAITEQIKDYTIQRYEIEDASKCIVLPNCINFEEYKSNIEVNQVEKVLIVSRLSYEKLNSITNAIKLYEKIKEKSNKKVSLTIVGGGNEEDTIKRYIEDNNIQDVEFKGKVSNINKILEEYDLLIGLDRCILEAIATKRLAVISGYDGIKGLIDETNIDEEIQENFCGKNLEEKSFEEIANKIISLDKVEVTKITEENYKKIRQVLDINNNIYISEVQNYKYHINYQDLMKAMITINFIIGKSEEEARAKIESNWQEHVQYKEWIEGQLENYKKTEKGDIHGRRKIF